MVMDSSGPPQKGPLNGVRIVDLSTVVFAPYATQILGDMGADVIKVEGPKQNEKGDGGDNMRYAGSSPAEGLGPIFMNLNRNKRSICLNLTLEQDRATLNELLETADVFVSNVRMAALGRLGFGYPQVAAVNPGIIYAHAAGYDSDGPHAADPAYDDLIQARSGLADLHSRVGGGGPSYLPSLVADKVSGLYLSQAVLAALYHRQSTGEGQFVEVPMLETITGFALVEHFFNQVYSPPTGDWGYPRVLSRNRQPFPTKDGHVAMLPYSTEQWQSIFEFSGRAIDIEGDPRYATFAMRTRNIDDLYGMLAQISVEKTTDEWIKLLGAIGVPNARVNRLSDLLADEQLSAVKLFERRSHPQAGDYYAIRSPMKFSKTPMTIRRDPPTLGEHTTEIRSELEVRRLTAEQARIPSEPEPQ